jgi:phosphate/sulfate permease
MLTWTGVSFAHSSNDGQMGMGLIMLILVGPHDPRHQG